MNRRYKMNKKSSQRNFTKHAVRTNKKNIPSAGSVMRGGIRL